MAYINLSNYNIKNIYVNITVLRFLFSSLSDNIFGQLFATENMKVDVLDRLTAVLADIGDNSVSVFKSASCGDLGYRLKNCGNIIRVCTVDHVGGFDMLSRYHDHVDRCLRIYILKRVDLVVGIYLC